MARWVLLTLFIFVSFAPKGAAAKAASGKKFGVNGAANFGPLSPLILQETHSNLTSKDGQAIILTFEKTLGLGFTIVGSVNYLKTTGTADYQYTSTQTTTTYNVNQADFLSHTYTGGLGLRIAFFESSPVHPFIEAGGFLGIQEFTYSSATSSTFEVYSNDLSKSEKVGAGGDYGTAGIEVNFSKDLGLRVGARYNRTRTTALSTLGSRSLVYDNRIYYLGILGSF